ncbi:hypothetical protein Z948_1382 [Sulfitobacter donghicola DSW-25 = KCTC 12864 = JCM 14565]|nr:hypothetical protein Z948_1382 [Sulfitobacter donghicola DSW-25 = KCTC 12864 = JCM 14565]
MPNGKAAGERGRCGKAAPSMTTLLSGELVCLPKAEARRKRASYLDRNSPVGSY